MGINLKFIIAILSFGFLFTNCSCHKFLCTRHNYNFSIDTTVFYPQRDSIHVGDTLYFSSYTSTTFKNIDDGQSIDYSKADNFGGIIGAIELSEPNIEKGAIGDFTWIALKGKVYTDNKVPSPEIVKQAIFTEEDGLYILSVAIIPLKKGIYSLSTGDMPDVVKNCDRATVTMKITNTDAHLHYLQETYYGGGPVNKLDSTHTYNFKVY